MVVARGPSVKFSLVATHDRELVLFMEDFEPELVWVERACGSPHSYWESWDRPDVFMCQLSSVDSDEVTSRGPFGVTAGLACCVLGRSWW